MKIPSNIATLIAGIILTLVSLWVGQNHGLMPVAASEEAPLVDGLFNMMLTVSTGLFLIVQTVIIYSVFKFRSRKGDTTDGPPVHGNVPLEILWTAIPAVIILVIGVYSFEVYNSMGGLDPMVAHGHSMPQQAMKMPGAAIAATLDGTSEQPANAAESEMGEGVGASPGESSIPDLEVNVTGLQFAWLFNYPETGITSGELHVPAGRRVKLNLSANDVIHSFWVPEFRLKQDAIPGRETNLVFTPKLVGTYSVICAELCGSYHGGMKTQVIVETAADFDEWVKSQQEVASQNNLEQAIALKPTEEMTTSQFLAPYAQEMGINADTIAQVHHSHH